MLRPRIIPFLLLKKDYLIKTINFEKEIYIGDPINAIKIFNEKKVDELIIADIEATIKKRRPNFELIRKISNQCFMPICYIGGVKNLDDYKILIESGVEKVGINSSAIENPSLISAASKEFGSQSVVVSIDLKRENNTYYIFTERGSKKVEFNLLDFILKCQEYGAGEIVFNFIDKDGTKKGFDIEMIEKLYKYLSIPSSYVGGASNYESLKELSKFSSIGICGGSIFVLKGKFNAVLINYPTLKEKKMIFDL